jgi:hypothetical protein
LPIQDVGTYKDQGTAAYYIRIVGFKGLVVFGLLEESFCFQLQMARVVGIIRKSSVYGFRGRLKGRSCFTLLSCLGWGTTFANPGRGLCFAVAYSYVLQGFIVGQNSLSARAAGGELLGLIRSVIGHILHSASPVA